MSHIICRYDLPGCACGATPVYCSYEEWCTAPDAKSNCILYAPSGKKLQHEYEIRGHKFTSECEVKTCAHFRWRHCEFEKDVKRYEYSEEFGNAGLEIRGLNISIDYINYLEIDGRVLINNETQETRS